MFKLSIFSLMKTPFQSLLSIIFYM